MKGPYSCLYREIWDDKKFYTLSEQAKLVYLFLISCPMGNGLGCFKAGMAAMIEEMRYTDKGFKKGFNEGLEEGLFEYNAEARVLLIPTYFNRNLVTNPNGIRSLAKDFSKLPDCDLKDKCYQIVKAFVEGSKEGFKEAFNERFEEPLGRGRGQGSGLGQGQGEGKKEPPKPDPFHPKKMILDYSWVDPDIWSEWIDFKKNKKASISERALKANVKTLEKLGTDKANDIIAASLNAGWTDFYQLKKEPEQPRELKYLG